MTFADPSVKVYDAQGRLVGVYTAEEWRRQHPLREASPSPALGGKRGRGRPRKHLYFSDKAAA